MNMHNSIGSILKKAREDGGFSIEDVLKETGVSNAYLDNLENNRIKTHSAGVLYKLSGLYDIPLKPLLIQCGIILKKTDLKS